MTGATEWVLWYGSLQVRVYKYIRIEWWPWGLLGYSTIKAVVALHISNSKVKLCFDIVDDRKLDFGWSLWQNIPVKVEAHRSWSSKQDWVIYKNWQRIKGGYSMPVWEQLSEQHSFVMRVIWCVFNQNSLFIYVLLLFLLLSLFWGAGHDFDCLFPPLVSKVIRQERKVTVLTFLLLASRALYHCSCSFTVILTRTPWYTFGLSAVKKRTTCYQV